MSATSIDSLETLLLGAISDVSLSPSHDTAHWQRVRDYSLALHKAYGGDPEVLVSAAILHDLGRSDPRLHGPDSRAKSVQMAKPILIRPEVSERLSAEQRSNILQAIAEHDDPHLTPSSLEGRILKDADFLSGFGAWGILRIAMWAAESGEGLDGTLRRLRQSMPERARSLGFVESRHTAVDQLAFAGLFMRELNKPAVLRDPAHGGKYIVFEGISGSGKDTQVRSMRARLLRRGLNSIRVREPTRRYKRALGVWPYASPDRPMQMFVLMADRWQLVQEVVLASLREGNIVLSNRSYLSTLVYQAHPSFPEEWIRYAHSFVPPVDLWILLDIDPGIAFARCHLRATAKHRDLGQHETLETLTSSRQRYKDILIGLEPDRSVIIDCSDKSRRRIGDEIWEHIAARILAPLSPTSIVS